MATNFQDALIDQLDPTRKKNPADMVSGGGFAGPSGNTGIAGDIVGAGTQPTPMSGPLVDATPPAAGASAPDYTKLGKYADKLQGYDMSKFDRPYDQLSEKYKVGLVNSSFDPNQGITPEYLKALNSLGIADYSGAGDKLTAMNGRNGGRYGAGGTADTIVGLKSGGNAKWGYWTDPALEAQAAAPHGGGTGGASPMLGGDAMSNINAALGKFAQSPDFLQQLIAQLRGGQ